MFHGKTPQPNEHGQQEPPVDPCGESHHPLDDDAELAHIGEYTPPPIEVGPDSDTKAAYDAPPPMVKPVDSEPEPSRIEHVPALGPLTDHDESPQPQPLTGQAGRKIRTFEQRLGRGGHEGKWKRQPNVTGTGAIHVKSFHSKLTGDSLEFLDSQINEWLDEHPEYEVKMVTTSIGEWTGKLKEPALIINVWV
ncbi:MAG: hypothetical protein H6810_06715 [Phycisphaeraceae bacterium]|nr:MAG: hypothetical protein H6810_06715 [Phycisphaeraceae bacterium]